MNSIKIRLNQFQFIHKLICSLFLFVIGYAYFFAQLNLQLSTRIADGNAKGLASVKDVVFTYHGDRSKTKLGMKINGSMREHLPTESDKLAIEKWIAEGRTEEGYQEIEPIFAENCVRCHPYDERPDYPLETYEEVYASAEPDKGMFVGQLARLSHFHAFGMGIFSMLLALIFSFSSFRQSIRVICCVLPFVAMLTDITSWWLTKLVSPIFAYTVLVGGGLMGLAVTILIFGSLYDMWLRKTEG